MMLAPSFSTGCRTVACGLVLLVLLTSSACVKRSRVALQPDQAREQTGTLAKSMQEEANDQQPASRRTNQLININIATANELETLPGIGKGLSQRIIAHREKYGPFRRPEHLIVMRGISDRRFRALRELITAE